MTRFISFLLFIVFYMYGCTAQYDDVKPLGGQINHRIWNGKDAKAGQFPYQALLFMTTNDGSKSFCGGSLVANNYVLTAAHCCVEINNTVVYLGLVQISEANSSYVVKRTVTHSNMKVHPNYDQNTIANDICLLKLTEPVKMSANISTIALPTQQNVRPHDYDFKSATISGFGQTNDMEGLHGNLEFSSVTLKPHTLCKYYYYFINLVTDAMLCSAKIPWTGPCHGDSGGPLTIKDSSGKTVEIGLVSWGVGSCASLINPVVYTYIPAHIDWIRKHMT